MIFIKKKESSYHVWQKVYLPGNVVRASCSSVFINYKKRMAPSVFLLLFHCQQFRWNRLKFDNSVHFRNAAFVPLMEWYSIILLPEGEKYEEKHLVNLAEKNYLTI